MSSNSGFETKPASTAEEFLEFLYRFLKSDEMYSRNVWTHSWLFRGQANVAHPLLPSIWRTDKHSIISKFLELYAAKKSTDAYKNEVLILLKKTSLGNMISSDVSLQNFILDNTLNLQCRVQIELELINNFLEQLMTRGIPLVRDDVAKISYLLFFYLSNPDKIILDIINGELDKNFSKAIYSNSVFSLAQHHGIPTRLLDWTTNPYIAAFFAADSALEGNKDLNELLAVFVIHSDVLTSGGISKFPFPRSDNPFLLAQKGEFTLYQGTQSFITTGSFLSIDDLLGFLPHENWYSEIQPIKITLPSQEAPKLLRLLSHRHDISRDVLMPTLDNIAHVVRQRYEIDLEE